MLTKTLRGFVILFIFILLLVVLLSSWTWGAAEADSAFVYEEFFDSYTNLDYHDPTISWNVFSQTLSLAPISGRYQNNPEIAPDNHGGVYVVWEEIREPGDINWDIYIQRVDERGNRLWLNDVRVPLTHRYGQMKPSVAVDPDGNAIVVWHDDREWPVNGLPSAVYAQKISMTGDHLWAQDVKVSSQPGYLVEWNMRQLTVKVDRVGQSTIVWQGNREGKWDFDIYAQKLDPLGNRLWADDVQVSDDNGSNTPQRVPDLALNSQGEAMVVWVDGRSNGEDIFAQRLDNDGNRMWINDVAVSTGYGVSHQGDVSIDLDSEGNGIIVWQYGLQRGLPDDGVIYAQKIAPSRQKLWEDNVRVTPIDDHSSHDWPSVAMLPNGQAIVVWHNYLDDLSTHMQQINPDGTLGWNTPQAPIPGRSDRYIGRIRLDAQSRIYLTWSEWPLSASNDVFLQQIDPMTGDPFWSAARRIETGDGSAAELYPDVVTSSNGQSTIVWGDYRRGEPAVHGIRIDENGAAIWPVDSLVNFSPSTHGWMPALAGDDQGNVVAAWSGPQGIAAQRLDENGNRQWSDDLIVQFAEWPRDPKIVRALDDTYYVVWRQHRPSTEEPLWDVYAQRLNSAGELLWATAQRINKQDYWVINDWMTRPTMPAIAVDNQGYLIVAWYGQTEIDDDIYVQYISPDGVLSWNNEVALQAQLPDIGEGMNKLWSVNHVVAVAADSDIFVTWVDNRAGDLDLYWQKLNNTGQQYWTEAKKVNSDTVSAHQRSPAMTLLTSGDPLIVWAENRNGPQEVFAQRFTPNGDSVWGGDVKVNQTDGIWPSDPHISTQHLDHAVVVWRTTAFEGKESIYAQRINQDGSMAWVEDKRLVSGGYYVYPSGMVRSVNVSSVPNSIERAVLTADMETNGGTAQFSLSNDGGENWTAVTLGVTHVFTTTGSDLRWQVNLTNSPSWADNAPVIHKVRLEYRTDITPGDTYEIDDTCVLAMPLQVNGAVQNHAFDQPNDEDWAWFEAVAGTTYVIQTAHAGSEADTILELRDQCDNVLTTDENVFGSDARLVFTAPDNAVLFVRVTNTDSQQYGTEATYDLSVRTYHPNGIAVIVAGHNSGWQLQSNIDYAADQAYQTLLGAGFPKNSIYYLGPNIERDVDGNGLMDDIRATATISNVRYAIQDWPRSVDMVSGVPFFVYMMDHGHYDIFFADGNSSRITAGMLDLWLSNLETATGADQITVIVDTCKSGSFIDVTNYGPIEISGANRIIVTSTSSQHNSFPSVQGSVFSDNFWTALGDSHDVWTAFQMAKQAIQARGQAQYPWLDDNGDAVFTEADGDLARGRGLVNVFGGSKPVIDWALVSDVDDGGTAVLTAQVRDDFSVESVYVEVFPPNYQPPDVESGETPILDVPVATLQSAGDDLYSVVVGDLTLSGTYRLVIYAQDDEGKTAVPQAVILQNGESLYLPLVVKP